MEKCTIESLNKGSSNVSAPKTELLVFRLKRDISDQQRDIICIYSLVIVVLEDRPGKKLRFNEPVAKLANLFNVMNIDNDEVIIRKEGDWDELKHEHRILKRLTQ